MTDDALGRAARHAHDVLRGSLGDVAVGEHALLFAHASALAMIGRPSEAAATFVEALIVGGDAIEPRHLAPLVVLARAPGAEAGAEDALVDALARVAARAPVIAMHGLAALGRIERAIEVGREAIAGHPALAIGLRNSVASMLASLARDAEALELIEENAAVQPDEPAWASLAAMLRARVAALPTELG